jgi:hypothetical protein
MQSMRCPECNHDFGSITEPHLRHGRKKSKSAIKEWNESTIGSGLYSGNLHSKIDEMQLAGNDLREALKTAMEQLDVTGVHLKTQRLDMQRLTARVDELTTKNNQSEFLAVYRDVIRRFRDSVAYQIRYGGWPNLGACLGAEEAKNEEFFTPPLSKSVMREKWPHHMALLNGLAYRELTWKMWKELDFISSWGNYLSHQGAEIDYRVALVNLQTTHRIPPDIQHAVPALKRVIQSLIRKKW